MDVVFDMVSKKVHPGNGVNSSRNTNKMQGGLLDLDCPFVFRFLRLGTFREKVEESTANCRVIVCIRLSWKVAAVKGTNITKHAHIQERN